jgi:hypothetical protein
MGYERLLEQDISSGFYCHECGQMTKPGEFCLLCNQCKKHCGCRSSLVQCPVCAKLKSAEDLCECCGHCEGCRVCDQQVQLQKGA